MKVLKNVELNEDQSYHKPFEIIIQKLQIRKINFSFGFSSL